MDGEAPDAQESPGDTSTQSGTATHKSVPDVAISLNLASRVCAAAARFKKGRALLNSMPLLKFHHNDDGSEEPYLDPEGLNMIRAIRGNIVPIVFIGDGRAGKSYLASRLIGSHDAFASSDSAEAVTEGIDVAVAASREGSNGTILVMDCEGGNNAMAAIRNLVNVFAVVACTQVVFVANSMLSEAALDSLATAMAARQLVKFSAEEGISPPRRLTFVVNKTTLKYDDSSLEKTLDCSKDMSRAETRNTIRGTFEERRFAAVKLSMMPDFEEDIHRYLDVVREGAQPLTVAGTAITGDQLCLLLETVRDEVRKQNSVNVPSITRSVLLDGHLLPLGEHLLCEVFEQLPRSLSEYDAELLQRDPRPEALVKFDEQTRHLAYKELVLEAREMLCNNMDSRWTDLAHQNEILGEQTKEIKRESRDVVESSEPVQLGGLSLLKVLSARRERYHVETRAVTYKKKGSAGVASEWEISSEPCFRLVDHGLKDALEKLPRMQGHLRLMVPTIFSFPCGLKAGFPCYMVLTDLHVMWWYGPTSLDVQPDHCLCLMTEPTATLLQDELDIKRFVVKWGDQGQSFLFESEHEDAGWWGSAFAMHAAVAGRVAHCFPDPNLPVPPCLNDLKERNMADIIRAPRGDCGDRCLRGLVITAHGVPAEPPHQPDQERPVSQRPSQIEMSECRTPLRDA